MKAGILVRTDADIRIGTGHAMRCLALAQICQENDIPVALASTELPTFLADRWRGEGASLYPVTQVPASSADAEETARLAHLLQCAWVVVDGYHFGSDYQRRLKAFGCRTLCLDDYGHAGDYCADCVLNQNPYADHTFYPEIKPTTRLLMGSRYLLLRREFRDRETCRKRSIPTRASKLLITLGGSDPDDATRIVLESLRLLSDSHLEARVVLGGCNPNVSALTATAGSLPLFVQIIRDSTRFSDWMEWADFAVSAGGTTVWELAFMGVPFVVVSVAGNQRPVAAFLERHRVAIDLGPTSGLHPERLAQEVCRLAEDYERRAQMSGTGQDLVDGHGASRVIQALGLISLRLQRAGQKDSRMLWDWVNDVEVRRFSFLSKPVSWEDHEQWFTRKLSDPNSAIWIAYNARDQPIGQIRFDGRDDGAVYISLSVATAWRGKGYGRHLIKAGLRQASRVFPPGPTHALIKVENSASVRTFEAAGFVLVGEKVVYGCKALHYILPCPWTDNAA